MKNNLKKKIAIFDLDGVLIDSLENMRESINQTNKKLKINISFSRYKKFLGLPFDQIMKNMHYKNISIIKKNYKFFSEKNLHKIEIDTKITKILKNLKKKYHLAIFTSKDRIRTKKILEKYNFFDYVVSGSDTKKGKPHPEGLIKILNKFKTKKTDAIFFGDSLYDFKASKAAKIQFVFVNWGYSSFSNIKSKKIICIKKYEEIEKILKKFAN